VPDQATGTAFICVSDEADNAITVAPGANLALQPEHLPALKGFTHLLMQLESPLESVAAYARAAHAQGVKVVLNAAPAQPLTPELMALLDVLIVNEGELRVLAGQPGSVAQCLARIQVPCVVVTLGRRGACARCDGVLTVEPAFDVTPVDTTGAGDTFCGVLVAALSREQGLPEALRLASAAAALACTRPGAQSSIPDLAEVTDFLTTQPSAGASAVARLRAYGGFDAI
jgi:ribokinase